ncbi:MAG TPA: SDR family NAD(P)-dependent oxidoreductase, partial [Candidatus Nanoarchaeia archaeon]|nr:SDR family NAD(P)-dependent oxidoreductase [Candidatus Nanoarchaeia archaeon]
MKKTAIIVGASADIGIKIVESLKKRDWNVYGTCNKNKEKLERQLDKSNIFKINLNSENSRRELEEMVIGIWRREKRVDAGVYVAGLWNPFFKF